MSILPEELEQVCESMNKNARFLARNVRAMRNPTPANTRRSPCIYLSRVNTSRILTISGTELPRVDGITSDDAEAKRRVAQLHHRQDLQRAAAGLPPGHGARLPAAPLPHPAAAARSPPPAGPEEADDVVVAELAEILLLDEQLSDVALAQHLSPDLGKL